MPLQASKYAPKTPAESLALSRAEKLRQDKAKAARLLGRLQWKAQSLVASYLRALHIWQSTATQHGHLDGESMFTLGTTSAQAESMFKVDFFEFYTLLERYLDLCLSIVGVFVHSTAPRTNVNALRFITNPEWAKTRPEASHAYHANLLEALDREDGPLHAAFSDQDVRIQLGFAKDYRNAWKNADGSGKSGFDDERRASKLPNLDLEKMLRLLVAACEHACEIVQHRTESSVLEATSKGFEKVESMDVGVDAEMPFEYTDDHMDID